MKVRDEMSTSYLMFLADQREPINTAGRSHKSHLFTMQVSTSYRTDDLKYSKVYLSLKTFKSCIEHSWFFTLLSLSVQQWPMILGTPSHITSVNIPCEGFICFPISRFSIDRTRRQKKSTPRFVNAANFSQTVILFKGINGLPCLHFVQHTANVKLLSWPLSRLLFNSGYYL